MTFAMMLWQWTHECETTMDRETIDMYVGILNRYTIHQNLYFVGCLA